MNECRLRVITNPAPGELQRGVPQLDQADAGHPDIDRLRLHVQAVPGHAGGVSAQEFVGVRGPVAADDLELRVRRGHGVQQVGQQIENALVIAMDLTGAGVAQKVIQLVQSLGNVGFAAPENDVDPFPGMGVVLQSKYSIALNPLALSVFRRARFRTLLHDCSPCNILLRWHAGRGRGASSRGKSSYFPCTLRFLTIRGPLFQFTALLFSRLRWHGYSRGGYLDPAVEVGRTA